MSWVISKKDNCILEGFKRIFKPKDAICENQACENIVCYYFDCQNKIQILCVCDKIGGKLQHLGLTRNKSIYCSRTCYN